MSEPTLRDDLDAEAKWADELMAVDGKTRRIVIEPSYRERAARLRAAAARLRGEMAFAQREADMGSEVGAVLVTTLTRINGGPHTPETPRADSEPKP